MENLDRTHLLSLIVRLKQGRRAEEVSEEQEEAGAKRAKAKVTEEGAKRAKGKHTEDGPRRGHAERAEKRARRKQEEAERESSEGMRLKAEARAKTEEEKRLVAMREREEAVVIPSLLPQNVEGGKGGEMVGRSRGDPDV